MLYLTHCYIIIEYAYRKKLYKNSLSSFGKNELALTKLQFQVKAEVLNCIVKDSYCYFT